MAQGVGDQYESATALADLSAVYYGLGEIARARMVIRKATRLAKELGAEPLHQALLAGHPYAHLELEDAPRGADETATELSDAERRVAALAAQGHKNREIARRLHITVSTVEQHLTRVYRKLGVTRRMDLPTQLETGVAG
jgi:DNA-binding CsgD family transcriptional regulator